jgi:hypothetical protein
MDEVLLLLIASERILELGEGQTSGQAGLAARRAVDGDPGADAVEIESLIQAYRELYAQYADKLRQQGYPPDDPVFAELRSELAAQTAGLEQRKEALLRARRRQQNPTVVRRVARFIGKILGGGVTATGKVMTFTMEKAVPGAIRLAPQVAQEMLRERVQRERQKLTERAWSLVSRRLGGDVTAVLREIAYPMFRRRQEARRRRRQARIQTQTAQAAVSQQSPGEAPPPSVVRVEVNEGDIDPTDSTIAWFNYDYTSPTSVYTVVDTLNLWLEFDFEHGELRGEFEATGGCATACDYPEEWASSQVHGRVVDGWLRPNDEGGWDWGGAVENEVNVAGLNVLGVVLETDGTQFSQTDEVSQSGTVPARITGSSTMDCSGATIGDLAPCFRIGGPWDTPPSQYLAFWLMCAAPECGLPQEWPEAK